VRWRYPYIVALLVMVLFGASDMVRGVAAPMMQRDWHLTYFQLSNIFVANSLGYLVGSFLSGWFIHRLGTRWTVLGSGMGLGVALLLIIDLRSFLALLVSFALAGIFSGWQEIGVNHVVPEMIVEDSLQSKYFNWLHGLYGAGAFVFPAIAGMLIRTTHSWRFPYIVLLAYLAVPLLLTASHWPKMTRPMPLQPKSPGSAASDVETTGFNGEQKRHLSIKSPLLLLLILSIGFYVMAEIGVASWLTTYLVGTRGFSINTASYVLSAFYFTFTVGRLTAHLWVPRVGDERSIVLGLSLAILLFSVALTARHIPAASIAAFALAGLGFSIVFPTIAAVASYRFAAQSGQVLGLLFTASGVGSLLSNWLIGLVSTTFNLNVGLWLVVFFLVMVLIGMTLLRRLSRTSLAH